jgi:hypothetical protein
LRKKLPKIRSSIAGTATVHVSQMCERVSIAQAIYLFVGRESLCRVCWRYDASTRTRAD